MTIRNPTYKLKAFDCPFCLAFSHMEWQKISVNERKRTKIDIAECSHCYNQSIWRSQLNRQDDRELFSLMVFPDNTINVNPSVDMPDDVIKDFNEAKTVFNKSPKSAAALLRLALQKLCKHLGEKGENINDDLKNLVKTNRLSPEIIKAADTVRITGNNAVHPGEMNDEDIDFVASKLFSLINLIIQRTITEPKEIENIYQLTPERAREAIAKRDNPSK